MGTQRMCWIFEQIEFVLPARTKTYHWPLKLR
jgi:hypothetical protein